MSRYELWFNNKLGFTRKPRILQDAAHKKKEDVKKGGKKKRKNGRWEKANVEKRRAGTRRHVRANGKIAEIQKWAAGNFQ